MMGRRESCPAFTKPEPTAYAVVKDAEAAVIILYTTALQHCMER